jgi:hypothetical protein
LVSRKPEEAPPLYPGADRFRWRRQVSAWVSYIQRRADAGDKLCKSHAAKLSDLLYAAAHPPYHKVLELDKSASMDFSVPTEKQPDVVQEIVHLIGFETHIKQRQGSSLHTMQDMHVFDIQTRRWINLQ